MGKNRNSRNYDDSLEYTPQVLHGLKPSTLQLFGIYLYKLRTTEPRNLSLNDLSVTSNRNPEWHAAVERGELIPTPRHLGLLQRAYDEPDPDVNTALTELHFEPWGQLASELRDHNKLDPPDPPPAFGDDEAPDSLFPILDEINRYDRLFVIGPILLLASLFAGLISLDPTSGNGPVWSWPKLEPYAISGLIALLLSSIAIPSLGYYLALTCRLPRRFIAREPFSTVQYLRYRHFIGSNQGRYSIASHSNWFRVFEMHHMPLAVRPALRSFGLTAELAERFALIFAAASAASVAVYAYSLGVDPTGASDTNAPSASPEASSDQGWLAVIAPLCLVTTVCAIAAQAAGKRFVLYLGAGLGLPSEGFFEGKLPSLEEA